MAEKRVGTVVSWQPLSPTLALFRLAPPAGHPFPDYRPGQYIALRREDCWLTRRFTDAQGRARYGADLDEHGLQRRGPVTHSYSISSAPCETRAHGWLEFYIVLEKGDAEYPGRLTESLFRLRPGHDDQVSYVDHIAGDFTLEKRAAGFQNVLMVGTGTGLAPFASMLKQLAFEARQGARPPARYTLLHANRTYQELAYHEELADIEAGGRLDFVYLPSVSRPAPGAWGGRLGVGRANNLLRHVFGLPLREEEELKLAEASAGDVALARAALARAVKPALPPHAGRAALLERLAPAETVILTCGNPSSMSDIRVVAESVGIRFEKEDWKAVVPVRP
jgi:ferredoxin-NADP reductase